MCNTGVTSTHVDVDALQDKLGKEQKKNEHLTEVILTYLFYIFVVDIEDLLVIRSFFIFRTC